MNDFQLQCFLAVADNLNFAKAAQQLNISQPAVTHQIRALEQELNVKLFRRTTRTVTITQAGLIFLHDAQMITNIAAMAKKRLAEPSANERQFLAIGCHSQHELQLLPEVLRGLLEACPAFCPVFKVLPFKHLYNLLAEETVDVIIAFRERAVKKAPGFYKELAKVPLMSIMSTGHPLAGLQALTAADLATERLIVLEPQQCPDNLTSALYEITRDKTAADLYFCDSISAGTAMAKAGFGVALFPELAGLQDRELAYVPLAGIEPFSYGAYYKSLAGRPLLKLFLQLCREKICLV